LAIHTAVSDQPTGEAPRRGVTSIFVAGLLSSGSTWVFNVVAGLLRAEGRSVVQFFAGELQEFPEGAEHADIALIKCHAPSQSLRVYRRMTHAATLLSVRDPRDAVASLMQRFGMPFEAACRRVAGSAEAAVALLATGDPLVLRYEDRFCDQAETVGRIAAYLGLFLPAATLQAIHDDLRREKVAEKIAALGRAGKFGEGAAWDVFDPQTHWHPGHVGDAESGKFSRLLSPDEQAEVLAATADFCRVFGYETEVTAGGRRVPALLWRRRYVLGTVLRFGLNPASVRLLAEGWAPPDEDHVWAIGEESVLDLYVTDVPEDAAALTLSLHIQPIRPPGLPGQRILVAVNGTGILETRAAGITRLEADMPRAVLGGQNSMRIVLGHPDAVRPCDHWADRRDTRKLSFKLLSMEIRAVSAA
jgi:hypothetical protein